MLPVKKEKWKKVPFVEGYEVSDQGRVRSKNKILKPGINAQGYPTVVLGRKYGTATVHSIVLTSFRGAPKQGQECRHKDGNRKNALLSNLCYGTRKQNIQDSVKHGTFEKRYAKMRHLTPRQIRMIRKKKGTPYKVLAVKYGVSYDLIGKAMRGEYAIKY